MIFPFIVRMNLAADENNATQAKLWSKVGFLNAYLRHLLCVFLCNESIIIGGRKERALDSINLFFFAH